MTPQKFAVIVEDPAWPEHGGGKSKRGADGHYPLMTVAQIIALPIRDVAADDAHYWLWATDNYLRDALNVMESRGFRFVRTWEWVKGEENDHGEIALQTGLGQYGRNCHEHLLFGTRGAAAVPPPNRRPKSVIVAKRGQHSAKPQAAWDVIEMVSRDGPRVEFNARLPREGWMAVGHETSGGTIEDFCAQYVDCPQQLGLFVPQTPAVQPDLFGG